MKILCLIDGLGSGGAQRQMVGLLKMLDKRGFEVELLCYHKEEFFAEELREIGIPIFWKISKSNVGRIMTIRKFIRGGHYDVVISFLTVPNFLNCVAAIGGRDWKVITGERNSQSDIFRSFRGKLFAWFQRYSDTIVCNSNNASKMWAHFYPAYRRKLMTIYNKINLGLVNSEYIPKRGNRLHIVVAASYDNYRKNPYGLINAINLMTDEEKECINVNWYGEKNVSIGGTKTYDECLQLIRQYDLEQTIHLEGPVRDIINEMNRADVVALVSSVEGLPNTICEGMMLGKPVLMTKVSDFEILVDESNGFLCDWDKPESIKDALIDAIGKSREQLIELGRNSKEKAIALFSEEHIVNSWVKLIENRKS